MTQLHISLPHSTRQLNQLHKQIMDLQNHFKHSEDHYKTKIKYRIKQSINKINCMGQSAEQHYRKKELQQAFLKDQIKHNELEKAFRQLFMQEYLSKTLSNKVLANDLFVRKEIEDRKLSAYPYSGMIKGKDQERERLLSKHEQRQLQILSKQSVENSKSDVRYELEKQKHLNYTLFKQVQLLQKELDHLNAYCQSITENKPNCEQSTHLELQNSQYPDDSQSQPSQQQQSDSQLSSQAQCLQRLIKTKSQLISQLSQSNHLLRLKTSQLNSRQLYLNKKRLLLQSNALPKLQRRLNQILEAFKKNLPQQELNHLNQKEKQKSQPQKSRQFKRQQLIATAQELSDIKQIINSTLAQQFMRQKRHFVQNHLY